MPGDIRVLAAHRPDRGNSKAPQCEPDAHRLSAIRGSQIVFKTRCMHKVLHVNQNLAVQLCKVAPVPGESQ